MHPTYRICIPPVVAVSLVDILEGNDLHIRESILPPVKELLKLSIWIPKEMDDLSNRHNFMAICFSQAFIFILLAKATETPAVRPNERYCSKTYCCRF